jgi:hypothetical protein
VEIVERVDRSRARLGLSAFAPALEARMAIVTVFELPGMTQEMYDQIGNKLTEGRGKLEKPSDWPAPGLISHTCAATSDGLLIVDVWESEQAFQQFGEVIVPLHQEVGAPVPEPRIHPVVNVVTG